MMPPKDEQQAAVGNVDLSNCEQEPIHLLGRVQSFGFLIGVSAQWTITHASRNIETYLGMSAMACIGMPLAELIGEQAIHVLRNRLQYLRGLTGVERAHDIELPNSSLLFDAVVHVSGKTFILEFEPTQSAERAGDDVSQVRALMSRLADATSIDRFFKDAARYMQLATGFDRVMVYKFQPDDSGEVIAESAVPGLESYLGLRYPASDIPPQARRLYLKNTLRIISNVEDDGSLIESADTTQDDPLDLSQSVLRSVSPIHLEYLRNMGVAASMSISIVVAGRLWGLFACHHNTPIILDQRKRAAADLFAQLFALLLSSRLAIDETAKDGHVAALTGEFSANVVLSDRPVDAFVPFLRPFLELLNADGFALLVDGFSHMEGTAPDAASFEAICTKLNDRAQPIFATDELGSIVDAGHALSPHIAGMLALSISRSPSDYIVFFRSELTQTIRWAGDPNKPVTVGPNGARLTPRKSFEQWQETVSGHSAPWTPAELRAAGALRLTLLEVVLRFTDVAARERLAARAKQDLLIAELNHRVRNILALVKGIVSQSQGAAHSTAEYVDMLDSRIQALARAHDLITQENWSAASFKDLLRIEAESYLTGKSDRFVISGEDFALIPAAFSTVALVIHELATNASKYGALADSRGRVDIDIEHHDNGSVTILWQERDGPPVRTPQRRGFGSTIIERSIPYELGGAVDLDYAPDGFRCRLTIPATFVQEWKPAPQAESETADQPRRDGHAGAPAQVLIVEDNLLIAMEAEDIFRGLGSRQVDIAPNLSRARTLLQQSRPDFVLLDINLGHETTLDLAADLLAGNIPIGFATGYGDFAATPEALAGVPRMSKPYERDVLVKLLRTAGFSIS